VARWDDDRLIDSMRQKQDSGPSPLIQYWHSAQLPDYIEPLVESFRDHNPDMRHLVFNESTAESFIGDRFSAREVAAFRSCAVPAMQADYFRYCAAYALGGMCVDADCRCTASLRPLVDAGGAELFRMAGGGMANGVMVFSRPGHPLLELVLDIVTTNIENRVCEDVVMVTGPRVIRTLVESRRFGGFDSWLAVAPASLRPIPTHTAEDDRRYLDLLREKISQNGGLVEVFDGVRVSSLAKLKRSLRHRGGLPYKDTGLHYANFEPSIFR
jgi:Glycosyltransferase sugar-binding region containing DXD motif